MSEKNLVKIRPIRKSDHVFLYELLKERDPRANISHREMPSFARHIEFVLSKPYARWYVIIHSEKNVGSVYLTKNDEIGIFIKKNIQGRGIGIQALKLLIKENPRTRYLANVSPKNKKSIRFFKNNGFSLIQHTYELQIGKNNS